MAKYRDVAVGVVIDATPAVLVTQRLAHQHQPHLWEFPGGKCELGETPREALAREMQEEVGIVVQEAIPILTIDHDYVDLSVTLHVFQVTAFDGSAIAQEGQPLQWQPLATLHALAFPAANADIVTYLINRMARMP